MRPTIRPDYRWRWMMFERAVVKTLPAPGSPLWRPNDTALAYLALFGRLVALAFDPGPRKARL